MYIVHTLRVSRLEHRAVFVVVLAAHTYANINWARRLAGPYKPSRGCVLAAWRPRDIYTSYPYPFLALGNFAAIPRLHLLSYCPAPLIADDAKVCWLKLWDNQIRLQYKDINQCIYSYLFKSSWYYYIVLSMQQAR